MTTRKTVAKIAIINSEGKILVLRRSETHPTSAHRTDLPGGIVDDGERSHEAVVREVKEEAGLDIDSGKCAILYTGTSYFPPDDVSYSRIFYVYHLDNIPEVTISWEHESYEWLTFQELLSRDDFLFFYRDAIEYALKYDLF